MPQTELHNPSEHLIVQLFKMGAKSKKELFQVQRAIAKEFKTGFQNQDSLVTAYRKLIHAGTVEPDGDIENLIRLKNTRSLSGIVVVSVLTKPYACPGVCLYCPSQSDVPKSYLANEPAVIRAITHNYDPYAQVAARLKALKATGHAIDKINIRIIGGTWSYYPADYQEWFIAELFRACNGFNSDANLRIACECRECPPPFQGGARGGYNSCHSRDQFVLSVSLNDLQQTNETAKCRIVEISVETRQDYINLDEINRLRQFGVTKVELGVQSLYDDVLKFNRRGNSNYDTIQATRMLRDAGFKVSYQMMPNLPGSDLKRDQQMFSELFMNSSYKPDHLKIYPLAIVKDAPVYKLYRDGQFKPYNKEKLVELLKKIKKKIPCYCRVERVIRDIPSPDIVEGGAKHSNLRQIVLEELKREGSPCQCIRCREVRNDSDNIAKAELFRQDYEASGGYEVFLTFESPDRSILYSLLRLRIPSNIPSPWKGEDQRLLPTSPRRRGSGGKSSNLTIQPFDSVQGKQFNNLTIESIFPALNGAALVRELHTYGPQLAIGAVNDDAAQHRGFGKRLLAEAERIAREEFKLNKIAVISGVGVRQYFRKLGYKLKNTYMVKEL